MQYGYGYVHVSVWNPITGLTISESRGPTLTSPLQRQHQHRARRHAQLPYQASFLIYFPCHNYYYYYYYYYYYRYCYYYYHCIIYCVSLLSVVCWLRRNPGKLFLPFRHPLPTVSLLYRPVYSFITESIGLLELLIWKLVIPVSTRLDSTRYPILPYHHTDTSIDARPRSDEDTTYVHTQTQTHIRTEYGVHT